MPKNDETIRILTMSFESSGWPLGLSPEKLAKRFHITSDEAHPGCDVVEIERHRGILGAAYVRGAPMSAYETYFMRYAVNTQTGTVRVLPERSCELDIDTEELVEEVFRNGSIELQITPASDGYTVSDLVSNDKAFVASEIETLEFVLSFAETFGDYFRERLTDDTSLSDERQRELLTSCRSHLEIRLGKH